MRAKKVAAKKSIVNRKDHWIPGDVIFEKSAPSPKKSSREREGFNENILGLPIVCSDCDLRNASVHRALVGWQELSKVKKLFDRLNRLINAAWIFHHALRSSLDGNDKSDR